MVCEYWDLFCLTESTTYFLLSLKIHRYGYEFRPLIGDFVPPPLQGPPTMILPLESIHTQSYAFPIKLQLRECVIRINLHDYNNLGMLTHVSVGGAK